MASPRQEIAKYVSQSQLSNVFTDYMGIINAKIYGAVGDGVTSDSSNLQLAVNAANDSSAYAIFLPQGTYSCTGLSSDSNILWWGDNAAFTGGYTGLIKQLGQWAIQPSGTTQGDILYYSSNNVWARLAKGTTDQILTQSSNSAPAWGAVPNAALSSDVALSTAGTTHGDLLYYSSDSKWVKLAKGTTDQVLVQSSNAAPAWGSVPLAAVPSGVVVSTAASTQADILYKNTSSQWVPLPAGTAGKFLKTGTTGGTAPSWANPTSTEVTGIIASPSPTTTGDVLYRDASSQWAALARGTTGQFLGMSSNSIPEWQADPDKAIRVGHTYTIAGLVSTASTDVNYINPFFVSLASGQAASISKVRHVLQLGTNITAAVQKNSTAITGLNAVSVTTNIANTTLASAETLADDDKLALVVTATSGSPTNLSFTIFIDYTQ